MEVAHEMAMLLSAFPDAHVQVEPPALHQAIVMIGHGSAEQDEINDLVTGTASTPTRSISIHFSHGQATNATLHIYLGAAYPQQAAQTAVSSDAAHCDSAWCRCAQAQAQEASDRAAAQGEPCLFELVDAFQGLLEIQHDLTLARPDEGSTTPGSKDVLIQGSSPPQLSEAGGNEAGGMQPQQLHSQSPIHVMLIKIDHMNHRGLYTRTIKGWAADLKLTGRLVMLEQERGLGTVLILLYLEGPSDDLAAYLKLHRTEVVDLDRHGRKCRERMMYVLLQQPSGLGKHVRAFPDFRDVQVASLGEAASVLSVAGMGHMAREAAGL